MALVVIGGFLFAVVLPLALILPVGFVLELLGGPPRDSRVTLGVVLAVALSALSGWLASRAPPRRLVLRILRAYLSPMAIGMYVGVLIPLMRYKWICSDPEIGHTGKMWYLERLPHDVVLGCATGLLVGLLVNCSIRFACRTTGM